MNNSRTANSLKNMAFGLGGQAASLLLGFVTRWVFIVTLGKEYLGVSGLFSNVLGLLSLANLGFGSAIIYSLYKPLAQNDRASVKGYMNLYRKVYAVVGVVVLALGLALLPFLPHLINGEVTVSEDLRLIYVLFLLQSAASYFFAYKQSLLTASQQNRVISIYHTLFMVLRNVLESVLLLVFRAYIPALVSMIVCQIAENIWLARVTDKKFPYLRDMSVEAQLTGEQKHALTSSVKAMFLYKISGTVINSTDNILISGFQGIVSVGLYSNYVYIVDVVRTFLSYIFNSMTASVGNYSVSESRERNALLYYQLFFASFWIYGFTGVCLGVLLNPFITLWIGSEYVLPGWTVLVIIVNYYTAGVQYASTTYREVTGMFQVGKYRPLVAAALNLGFSVVLAKPLGITGVLLGTILSRLAVYFWFDPYIIHKRVFCCSLGRYFGKYALYAVVSLVAGGVTLLLCRVLPVAHPVAHFVLSMVLCTVVPNVLFWVCFRNTKEYNGLKEYARMILAGIRAKLRPRHV